jgi:anti-sigma B factor antagonist
VNEEEQLVSTDDQEPRQATAESNPEPPDIRANLTIGSRTAANRTILTVEGELDLYTAPILRDRVLTTFDEHPGRLIVDLTGVPFMDSSGLGVIVTCLKHVRESGGDLALVTPPASAPTKLLALTGLDRAIPTYATVDDVLA